MDFPNTEVAVGGPQARGLEVLLQDPSRGGGEAGATIQQAAQSPVATGFSVWSGSCVFIALTCFSRTLGKTRIRSGADAAGGERRLATGVDKPSSIRTAFRTPVRSQVELIAKGGYMHRAGATSKDFGAVRWRDRKPCGQDQKAYF